jgi:FR47-like protein
MVSHFMLLQLLLYMDFGGSNACDYATQHCLALKSGSLLRPCNRVCNEPDITGEEVASIKQYFDTVPFTWLVEADDVASNAVLQEHGLCHIATFPAMIADITMLPDASYAQKIVVKEISGESDVATWISIVSQSYQYPPTELSKAIHYFIDKGLGAVKLYLGFYEGNAVAASMLVQHETMVSMHMVCTIPTHRGKGLGYAMTHTPLRGACAQGFVHALLLTSKEAESIYARLGFKEYAVYHIYG